MVKELVKERETLMVEKIKIIRQDMEKELKEGLA
jgi:hypothetical protein